jgi:E3 ubiquitin-protein ligase MARCH6
MLNRFRDALLEFPVDLVILHVFGPWILKVSHPRRIFRSAVRKWFEWSAKKFSLTSFLFGGRHADEEEDIYMENILSSTGLPQPGNYRFLRVPNHDHIEVTPGVRDVMIPCRENDPLFGRPHESNDEVRANWTKVYVPKYFKPRVMLNFVILVASVDNLASGHRTISFWKCDFNSMYIYIFG